MRERNTRYLLEIMIIPENNTAEQKSAASVARRLGNVLNEYGQTPNARAILDYCESNKDELDGFIEQNLLHLKIEPVDFEPGKEKPNAIFNSVVDSEKSKVRVMLYPGAESDVEYLKLPEATHNMIIRFDKSAEAFSPVVPHTNTPNFYQLVASDEIASLYIEALLVDASMCHFIGISDAAMHHDEKQNISHDKVEFLLEYVNSRTFENDGYSDQGANLIKYATRKLSAYVPYISFLSIFTIASLESNKEIDSIKQFFKDYCILWQAFQRWYYVKHQRMLSKNSCSVDAIKQLFDRNKYNGQISFEAAQTQIQSILNAEIVDEATTVLGSRNRYAFVILKSIPNTNRQKAILDSLFKGQIHQATWVIVSWNKLKDFAMVNEFIEIIPFMTE